MAAAIPYLWENDDALLQARSVVRDALRGGSGRSLATGFFHAGSNTVSYVVADTRSGACAVIDPVLDFDFPTGRTSTAFVDEILRFIDENRMTARWILETHVHADHLSAAPYLRSTLGCPLGIGSRIWEAQQAFQVVFNLPSEARPDPRQFDHLFEDGQEFAVGDLRGLVLHTPGHTPVCAAYVIGDAAFVGDTLFMPDYGTARADFPGGDARQLYRSIRRILSLPLETRIFVCHDYKAQGREEYCWISNVESQRSKNIHVQDGVSEDAFVALRTARDSQLTVPQLFFPSVQVNIHGGSLPAPEANGLQYLRIPLNWL
jgi:glyoxylase-like metal-dependent hydrolase (beta-lactamase superfamily II)